MRPRILPFLLLGWTFLSHGAIPNLNVTRTGYSSPFITRDLLTIRHGQAGTVLWTNRYNGSPDNDDFARRVVFDDAENCYVVGETFDSNNVRDIFAIIKYALDGTALWTNRHEHARGRRRGISAFARRPAAVLPRCAELGAVIRLTRWEPCSTPAPVSG